MAQEGEPNQSMAREGEPNQFMAQERTSPKPNPESMHMDPCNPRPGGIFFERNLRTEIISSNEERF